MYLYQFFRSEAATAYDLFDGLLIANGLLSNDRAGP